MAKIPRHAIRTLLAVLLMVGVLAPFGAIAEPGIVGSWATEDGAVIEVSPCDGAYCANVASGTYQGAAVARVSGAGPTFKGRVHDPRSGESYPGSLTLAGGKISLQGCIMEVFCKTVQQWKRVK